MTTNLFPSASTIAQRDGEDIGQFIGVNFGLGMTVTDQGKILGVAPTITGLPLTIAVPDDTPVHVVLATLAEGDVYQADLRVKLASADGTTRQVFKMSGLYYGAPGPAATEDGTSPATVVGTGTGIAVATYDLGAL